jgi:hypothetical protein
MAETATPNAQHSCFRRQQWWLIINETVIELNRALSLVDAGHSKHMPPSFRQGAFSPAGTSHWPPEFLCQAGCLHD